MTHRTPSLLLVTKVITKWNRQAIGRLISKKMSLYVRRDCPAPCGLGSLRGEGVGNEYLQLQCTAGLAYATRGMDAAAGLAARPLVIPDARRMAVMGPGGRFHPRHPQRQPCHWSLCCTGHSRSREYDRGADASERRAVRAASCGCRVRGRRVAGVDRTDTGPGCSGSRGPRTAGRGGGHRAA